MTSHFRLLEVDDAAFFAGELFKRVFGGEIPTYPRHFVCLYQVRPGELRTAGYVHFSRFESMHLVGGLVVDKAIYPSIPAEHLAELGRRPSIGEFLMREGIAALGDSVAVFALIGDRRSVEVNLSVGYVPTHIDKLYAFWQRDLPDNVKRLAAERVMKIAPF
jgi:hypothetical protein